MRPAEQQDRPCEPGQPECGDRVCESDNEVPRAGSFIHQQHEQTMGRPFNMLSPPQPPTDSGALSKSL